MRNIQGGLLIVSLIVTTFFGCENPAYQKKWARREDNLKNTMDMLADIEARRLHALGYTLDLFEDQHERDLANSRQIPDKIHQWWQEEILRWETWAPIHRQRIHEQLQGDPEAIEQILPEIFH